METIEIVTVAVWGAPAAWDAILDNVRAPANYRGPPGVFRASSGRGDTWVAGPILAGTLFTKEGSKQRGHS